MTSLDRCAIMVIKAKGGTPVLPEQDEFLERLFRAYFNELELYAYALLKNRSDAEAAVQEAFHIACTKINEVMASPNQVGWMKKTIKNISRNMRRRRLRESLLVTRFEDLHGEPGVEDSREFELYEQCKAVLTAEEYDLLIDIYINGIPVARKAEELGVSIWACYKRVNKALEKLRRELENEK